MARKKTREKPRSPITTEVFEDFIKELRAESLVNDAVCDRLESLLISEEVISEVSLKAALFPDKEGGSH